VTRFAAYGTNELLTNQYFLGQLGYIQDTEEPSAAARKYHRFSRTLRGRQDVPTSSWPQSAQRSGRPRWGTHRQSTVWTGGSRRGRRQLRPREVLFPGRTNILRTRSGCGSLQEKDAAYALGAANGKERKLALTISWFVIALWLFRGVRVLPRRDKAEVPMSIREKSRFHQLRPNRGILVKPAATNS
jgi:hypothetical protein